jgi:two-component system CheB/CheR fusion protein
MGAEISLIVLNRGLIPVATQAASAPATLKTLLGKVRSRTKVDFSQYKEPTLWRRIERRMAANHVSTLHDYLQVVDQTPVELDKLCKDILISVTAFFRDTDAFARLDKVVADILASKQPGDDIRVWVAGCATGEEAYSLAILFSERLGAAFDQYRLQIFATDIDLDAMALARRGVFAASSLAHMDRGRIRANFTPHGDRYEINKNLRDVVIFARQDLVQDPPFLRLDLVSCRNVLIYFQSELQARLLSVFHYALNAGRLPVPRQVGRHLPAGSAVRRGRQGRPPLSPARGKCPLPLLRSGDAAPGCRPQPASAAKQADHPAGFREHPARGRRTPFHPDQHPDQRQVRNSPHSR